VSTKCDASWKAVAYSIIVCPKTNEEYTTSFFYTLEDAKTLLWINNEAQAKALVWQSCQILKTLKIA
jgi:hypothetical protein